MNSPRNRFGFSSVDSSKWFECFVSGVNLFFGDEAAAKRLLHGLPEQVRSQMRLRAVVDGSLRLGDGDRAKPGPFVLSDVRVVQNDSRRNAEAPLSPGRRKREVELGRENVGEIVKSECRLMGEDPGAFRPEPNGGQVLVSAGWKMYKPVDSSPDADHPADVKVVHQKLRGVAGLGRLPGREEAILGHRDLEEMVPAGVVGR